MGDTGTVMWKELKEITEQFAVLRRGGMALLTLSLIFGVLVPWQLGPVWLSSPLMLFYWPFIAASMSSTIVADAFAGERERHTLETLLASRLPDRPILVGKVLAAILYGVGFISFNLLLGALTINVAHRGHGLLFFPTAFGITLFTTTLLFACLVSAIGLLVSLRAPSAREAQQTVGIALTALTIVPIVALTAIPETWRARLVLALREVNPIRAVLLVTVTLLAADLALLGVAIARFRRGRLLLD